MRKIDREELKLIFKKVKHFRLPQNFTNIDFENLYYFGWIDESDDVCYLATEFNGDLRAIRGEINRMPSRIRMKHMCSICKKQKEFNEIGLFTAKNKKLPKGIEYKVSGVYICIDFQECNKNLSDNYSILEFIDRILTK